MYIILKNGKRLEVDISTLTEDDEYYCKDIAAVLDDDTFLKKIWVLNGYKYEANAAYPKINAYRNDNIDLCALQVFEHEPTENEILYFMSANGLRFYHSYISIEPGYVLAKEED